MLLQRNRCVVLLLLAFAAAGAHAQEQVVVLGTVKTDSGRPLADVSILVDKMGVGAISNYDGKYSFAIPAQLVHGQSVSLKARLLRYAPESATVILAGESIRHDFILGSKPLKLVSIAPFRPDSANSEAKEIEADYGLTYPKVLKSAHLVNFQFTRHEPGEREIRIWSGLSIGIPKQLYRVVYRNGVARGEVIYHWEWSFSVDSDVWKKWRSELRSTAPKWCDQIRFEDPVWTCRAKFATEPDWSNIWNEMEADGVFRPHDYSLTKSKYYIEADGMEFTVELWDGHAYHRWTPRPGNSPEELARGAALETFLSEIGKRAVRMR